MIERHSPIGESDDFATCSEYGLYLKALDWCLREAGQYLPSSWLTPNLSSRAGMNAAQQTVLSRTASGSTTPISAATASVTSTGGTALNTSGLPARRSARGSPTRGVPMTRVQWDKCRCPAGVPLGQRVSGRVAKGGPCTAEKCLTSGVITMSPWDTGVAL